MIEDRFKCRIWDDLEKKYYDFSWYVNNIETVLNDIEYSGTQYNHNTDKQYNKPQRYFIESCTGLKDYNGNLIFDGDKIQTIDSKGNPIVKNIKYIATKAAFCMANDYEMKYDDCWDIWQSIRVDWLTEFEAEIIGNIHTWKF
jgi:hypothetical protein